MTTLDAPAKGGALTANLVCVASMLAWAAGFPAAEALLDIYSAPVVAAVRMGVAAIALLFIWIAAERPGALSRMRWPMAIFVGGLGFGTGSVAMIAAQEMTGAVTTAVVTSTLPVVGLAMEAILDGRRLTLPLLLGTALSLAGGVVAIMTGAGTVSFGLGAFMAFLSVFAFAWGSRATVRALGSASTLGRAAATTVGAALATALLAIIFSGPPGAAALAMPEARTIGLVLFAGLVGFALSQTLWIVSAGRLGVGLASMHINVAPFYVMVFMLAAGGGWNWPQAFAALVVGLGVIVAQIPSWESPG